jgi:FAD/FMN-containing dehydrogenase
MSPYTAATAALVKTPVVQTDAEKYCSWGRHPRVSHQAVYRVHWTDQLADVMEQAAGSSLLAYGLGRSYGDCCLNEGRSLVDCSRLDRFLDADFDEGWIRCEAGTSLGEILKIVVPRGWFLPVTTGTKFVTVGGAIANDVHGKNHHRAGTFGCHVRKLGLYRSDYGLVTCSPEQNQDMFRATIGGLGLTGLIAWAEIQLKRIRGSSIDVEAVPFDSLDRFLVLTAESDKRFEYTVAWIDCLCVGKMRGIFFRGNHTPAPASGFHLGAGPKVPFTFPEWVLNRFTAKMFNSAYYWRNRLRIHRSVVHYEPFFYPLDSVRQWNRIYGKQGLLQYQCVIPEESSVAFGQLLQLISASSTGSFLAVLKRFGAYASPGMLSFPRPGLTLALDFPMRGEPTLKLLQALDGVVMSNGGALYPAKDARMSRDMFEASFPNWRELCPYIDSKMSSSFWRRVTGRK